MIRLSTIPPPLQDFNSKCIDWGSCGICAIAARNSVLLFQSDFRKNSFSFLRVIEFSTCEIYAVKFHHEKPLLAISRDSGILVWDCESGKTKCGINDIGNLTQIEWCRDILIGFSHPNIIYGINFLNDSNDRNGINNNISSYDLYNRNRDDTQKNNESETKKLNDDEFQVTKQKFELERPKIEWQIELKGEYNGISVDPFSSCRIAAFSNNYTTIYQSENNKIVPRFVLAHQILQTILDVQFHPQIPDLLFFLTNNSSILSFEILTRSSFVILHEENSLMKFEKLILSLHSHNILFVICSDSTFIIYETNDIVQLRKKCAMKLQPKMKKENCSFLCHPLLENLYLYYSKSVGLATVKILNGKPYFVAVNQGTPHSIASFDFIKNWVIYGTENGDIYIVDVFQAVVEAHFNFGKEKIKKIKFLGEESFLWLVEPCNHAYRFTIPERKLTKYYSVSDIFANKSYGIIQHESAYLEIVHKKYRSRNVRKLFLQTEIAMLAMQIDSESVVTSSSSSSIGDFNRFPEVSIIERHRSVSAMNRAKFSFTSKVNNFDDPDEVNSIINGTGSDLSDDSDEQYSDELSGGKLAFITTPNQSIVIYDILIDKFLRKLQCPKEMKKISSISYTKNLILLSDCDGSVCLVNLKLSNSRLINSIPFDRIKNLSFQKHANKFALLSTDNKLAIYDCDNPLICHHFVSQYIFCGKSLILVQSAGNLLKFISDDTLLPIKQSIKNESKLLPNKTTRIQFANEDIDIDKMTSSQISDIYARYGCPFESMIWKVTARYLEGKLLPLKYVDYSGTEENKSLNNFRCSLIQSTAMNYESSLYQLLIAIRCNNIEKKRCAILSASSNLYGLLAAALIDSKISENAIPFIEQTAMESFDSGKILEALILMELISCNYSSAAVLQSKDRWNLSLEILRSLEKSEGRDKLILNTAIHYLNNEEIKHGILILVSIGDFHAALYYILKKLFKENENMEISEKSSYFSFLHIFMMFIEDKQTISDSKQKIKIGEFSVLKNAIEQGYQSNCKS